MIGGVCNNSGGSLVRRGPAYTEYALYARIDEAGNVLLRNHLGLALGENPEAILRSVDEGYFNDADICDDHRAASCSADYADEVRRIDEPRPARFNADPSRLYETSGSAGRVMVFAVRLDTFPKETLAATFYIGTNDAAELTQLRHRILTTFRELPASAEYIHRDAFDIAAAYGKDVFLAIAYFGTDRLPLLFALKNRVDALATRLRLFPGHFADKLLQTVSGLLPQHLPPRMRQYRDRFEHHLILKVVDEGVDEARRLLSSIFPSASGDMFECTGTEAKKAFLQRFAVAGAAVRYRAIHSDEVEDIVALDVALRRNDPDWCETLTEDVAEPVVKALYYGHFFCHVFHQDYIVRKGTDVAAFEHRLWELLDQRGAEYPAEHNVGHIYRAKPALAAHYRALDPGNRFNPGIGQTSRRRNWH